MRYQEPPTKVEAVPDPGSTMMHSEHSEHSDPASTHRARGPSRVACSVITVSDTRTPADDRSGDAIRHALVSAGHRLVDSQIVKDDAAVIRAAITRAVSSDAQAVVMTGGTGLTARDSTFEVLSPMLERPIPGFGELFRALSYEEIGAAAMISRAVAGVIQGTVIFALPGSSKAVKLGMNRLILPELGHILEQLSR